MMVYLLYAVYFFIITRPHFHHSENWMHLVLITIHFVIITHTIGTWLIVSLTVFWFIVVRYPLKAKQLCNLTRSTVAIISAIAFGIRPMYTKLFSLYSQIHNLYSSNVSSYSIVPSDIARRNELLTPISFWIYSVLSKLIPCIVIAILCTCAIISINRARRNRKYLSNDSNKNRATQNKTNWMIVAVVVLFVVTEFPHGVMAGISALNIHFFYNIYGYLGDIMDLLAIINSAINFILFCAMSRQFRKTFKQVFNCR
ncbi:hypothetical protein FSP39_003960 [Pinctada imbricata]|uniref:G-protein coupled receptors family 1 profile domain-containing protein n=1 Tax=Pinctada imbricata TaxID=66713 RepID=A0AA88YHG7_PINIB|nr:hypothetical protein FSP39_003960 [Pinctada imbricata]